MTPISLFIPQVVLLQAFRTLFVLLTFALIRGRLSKVAPRINDVIHFDLQCSYFLRPCSEEGNRWFRSRQTEIPITEKVHQGRKIRGYISTNFIYVYARGKDGTVIFIGYEGDIRWSLSSCEMIFLPLTQRIPVYLQDSWRIKVSGRWTSISLRSMDRVKGLWEVKGRNNFSLTRSLLFNTIRYVGCYFSESCGGAAAFKVCHIYCKT